MRGRRHSRPGPPRRGRRQSRSRRVSSGDAGGAGHTFGWGWSWALLVMSSGAGRYSPWRCWRARAECNPRVRRLTTKRQRATDGHRYGATTSRDRQEALYRPRAGATTREHITLVDRLAGETTRWRPIPRAPVMSTLMAVVTSRSGRSVPVVANGPRD